MTHCAKEFALRHLSVEMLVSLVASLSALVVVVLGKRCRRMEWPRIRLPTVDGEQRLAQLRAEKMLRKAIELDPKEPLARWTLSIILENKKDIPGAIKLMEECVNLGGVPGMDGEQRLADLRAKLETSTQ